MTVESSQIIIFYIVGIVMFVFGIEEDTPPRDYIYLGLSFLINTMGYYLSYDEDVYVKTAYLPLVLLIFSVLMLIYKGFTYIQHKTNDDYTSE